MEDLKIPTRQEVSPANQEIFDNLKKKLGFVPLQYAAMANSESALQGFLHLQDVRSSFGAREKMVVNLLVSAFNESNYCIAQHTEDARSLDLTEAQIEEIKKGCASFDPKLDALANLTRKLVENNGKPGRDTMKAFYNAGFNYGHVVDLMVAIGERFIINYLCNVAKPPIDFPATAALNQRFREE